MSEEALELESSWNFLNSNLISKLEEVLDSDIDICNPPRGFFSVEQQTAHYALVYNMCTKRDGNYEEIFYRRYRDAVASFLRRKVKPLLDSGTEPMRLKMAIAWVKFKTFTRVLWAAFSYLDRFYVELYGLPDLRELAISQFKKIFLEYRDSFSDSIIEKYDSLRESDDFSNDTGENVNIDNSSIDDLSISFEIYSSLDPENILFKSDIELGILERSMGYYDKISKMYTKEYDLEDYFIIFNEILAQELSRSKSIFGDRITGSLTEVLVKAMIKNRLNDIKNKLYYLEIFKIDTELLYQTLSMLPEGLILICDYLINQIELEADKLGFDKMGDDFAIISKVIDLSNRFGDIVTKSFSGDKTTQKSLDKGIEIVLNDKMDGEKSAMFLAKYVNLQILKGGDISKSMILFSHLRCKLIFIEEYRLLLANRLLNNSSLDKEVEAYHLLTEKAGSRETAKINDMIQDIANSNQISERISKDSLFTPFYLTSEHWSDLGDNLTHIILHPSLTTEISKVEKVYLSTLKHRTLRWIPRLGRAILSTETLEIDCDLIQATILLHITSGVTNVEGLASEMGIKPEFVLDLISEINEKCAICTIKKDVVGTIDNKNGDYTAGTIYINPISGIFSTR